MRELKRRGAPLSDMNALEMFGGDGSRHTLDYCRLVKSLDIWEVNQLMEPALCRNFPTASITIGNSFEQILLTKKTYDLLVIDNSAGLFGLHKEYCEHFEAFAPSLFRILRPSAVVILNVVPDLEKTTHASDSTVSTTQLARRAAFYQTEHPAQIAIDQMVPIYAGIARRAGFEMVWHFTLCRTVRTQVHYLVMKLSRLTVPAHANGCLASFTAK
ncbi:MAG TPA: hypothetical protein VGD64_15540 [Acidisarcina sp.]